MQDFLQNLLYKNTEENHLSDCMIMKKIRILAFFPIKVNISIFLEDREKKGFWRTKQELQITQI